MAPGAGRSGPGRRTIPHRATRPSWSRAAVTPGWAIRRPPAANRRARSVRVCDAPWKEHGHRPGSAHRFHRAASWRTCSTLCTGPPRRTTSARRKESHETTPSPPPRHAPAGTTRSGRSTW